MLLIASMRCLSFPHPIPDLTRRAYVLRIQESVYEAMYWGTPLLVLPSFVDQVKP